MRIGKSRLATRHLGVACALFALIAWMTACNAKPSSSPKTTPDKVQGKQSATPSAPATKMGTQTPTKRPNATKPVASPSKSPTATPPRKTPAKPTTPANAVKIGAWCTVYGSYAYDKLKTAQARARKITAAGLVKAHVFDTRSFLNLPIGELVVIGLTVDDRNAVRAEVEKAKRKKLRGYHKRCRTGSFHVPSIRTAKDILPQPTMPKTPFKLTTGSQAEVGCFAWSPKLHTALCVVGDAHLGTVIGEGEQGWSFRSVGVTATKAFVISKWTPGKTPAPDDAKRITPKLRQTLGSFIAKQGFVSLPESHDMVRGDQLAFASPRIRFRFTQTKAHVKQPTGNSWTDYANVLEMKCGKEPYKPIKEWESTSSGEVTVWRVPGSGYFVFAGSYEIGREGEIGEGSWAKVVAGKACVGGENEPGH